MHSNMTRWVNNFSVMLQELDYNGIALLAREIVDRLQEKLKKRGYLDEGDYVKFDLVEFIPGDKSEVTVFDKAVAKLDWEVRLLVPTFEMPKDDALKLGKITESEIARVCRRTKYTFFKTLDSRLGYIRFDQCQRMTEEDEAQFSEPTF